MAKGIYVSLSIDNLDRRSDPEHSDCIATYQMSEEDRKVVMALIRKYRHPHQHFAVRPSAIIECVNPRMR